MTGDIVNKLESAEMLLIGIGEELDVLKKVKKTEDYQRVSERVSKPEMLPFVDKVLMEAAECEECEVYKKLAGQLAGKDYFIISLCMDGCIKKSGLALSRIVEPCGGYARLQCSEKCCEELYDITEEALLPIQAFTEGMPGQADTWKEPVCPHCGSPLVFNNINALKYVEEGYLSQWQAYKKWLQKSVNKKLCILEIGVGLKYPTVIRWPFEKILYYNQKAELFRVHSRLYQIPEEVKGRAHGICQSPGEFIKELAESFNMEN